jgi:hypothetical protein
LYGFETGEPIAFMASWRGLTGSIPAAHEQFSSIPDLEVPAGKGYCMSTGLDDSGWLSVLPQADARENAPALTSKNKVVRSGGSIASNDFF